MQMSKKTTTAIALLLMMSFAVSLVALPAANAHDPLWKIPTFAYVAATPDPIGVGQTATVGLWLTNVYDSEAITNDYRFHNFELTIAAPNGKVVVSEIFDTATPDSFCTYYFTPDQAGTYTINFTFPGQDINAYSHDPNSAYVNDTYLPSQASCTLTVQQEPIAPPLGYPLPTEYWTRPISGQNTGWKTVASNYVESNVAAYSAGAVRYVPGVAAPNTGHILWTKPIEFGGYTGVNPVSGYNDAQAQNSPVSSSQWYDGRSYQDRFNNPIIISGNLYFALPVADLGAPNTATIQGGYTDIDLRTGETVWTQYYTNYPSFGIVINPANPNQYGAYGYLVATSGSTWIGYDAYTGDWVWNITNVPSGWSRIYGPEGEPLIYTLHVDATGGGWLALWNFTDTMANGPDNFLQMAGAHWAGLTRDVTAEGSLAYSWNVTIPASEALPSGTNIKFAYYDDLALCADISGNQFGGLTSTGGQLPLSMTALAISLQAPTIGKKLWQQTYTTPNNVTFELNSADPDNNVFIMVTTQTMQFYGYNMNSTGNKLYGPVGNLTAYNYYSTVGMGRSSDDAYPAYGNFYVGGYGGILYCFNDLTGDLVWTYGNGVTPDNNTNSGLNTPYGNYPCFVGLIANGIVFIYNGNHGNGVPIYKGETITAINATTGALIWREQAEVEVGGFEDYRIPVADGDIAFLNCYTMSVTCIGQGPSATTVQTPLSGVTQGSNLVIQGTVVDTSAGTQQTQQKADFPNGVPCVSDESEGAWMDYVYQQFPMPTNVTGVLVTIYAIDPNGNCVTLGTTTTDSSGFYSLNVDTNNLEAGIGLYKVIASFAGSNAYWGSSAESAFTVMEAPAPTAAPTPMPQSAADLYFVPAVIGIIIAIIVVGAVIVLMQRKRP
jgi:hypothetical protein